MPLLSERQQRNVSRREAGFAQRSRELYSKGSLGNIQLSTTGRVFDADADIDRSTGLDRTLRGGASDRPRGAINIATQDTSTADVPSGLSSDLSSDLGLNTSLVDVDPGAGPDRKERENERRFGLGAGLDSLTGSGAVASTALRKVNPLGIRGLGAQPRKIGV